MTREDILRMAREAWGEGKEYCFTGPEYWPEVEDMFERFAALVAAAAQAKTVTITGTYEEFVEFVRMACLHETIYDDSEGRQILVLRMLDAYGMAHSWALEHTRNNLS